VVLYRISALNKDVDLGVLFDDKFIFKTCTIYIRLDWVFDSKIHCGWRTDVPADVRPLAAYFKSKLICLQWPGSRPPMRGLRLLS